MKKFLSLITAVIITATSLIGCGASSSSTETTGNSSTQNTTDATNSTSNTSDTLNIVTTIFPVYDWVKEIVGDSADINVVFLCDSGIDLHNYQPTIEDIITIKESDLFVYIGGDSDKWAVDVVTDEINSLKLIDTLGDSAVLEEFVEGMQHDHSHDDHDEDHDHDDHDEDHDHDDHDDHDHDEVLDEHIWLSLKNAQILVKVICDELTNLLPDNTEELESNTYSYIEKLQLIDDKYEELTSNASLDTILVADRFPLRYLVEDYDLEYYAAFSGCSADAEVSFETMKFLTDKTVELDLDYILIIEGSNYGIAETICEISTDTEILSINSMQSVTQNSISEDVNYLNIMESNLEILDKVLN